MADSALEIGKIIIPWVTGGLAGAGLTWIVTVYRNRIQPVQRQITVSYIDLPKVMRGYNANISLTLQKTEEPRTYNFSKIAIVQISLKNTGNKDIEKFDLGINIPEESKVIGFEYKSEDRLHVINHVPEVTIENPTSQIDLIIQPFNRKDKYDITLIVNSIDKKLSEQIELSKTLSVVFVNTESRAGIDMIISAILTALSAILIGAFGKNFLKDFGQWVDLLTSIVATIGFGMLAYFFYKVRSMK